MRRSRGADRRTDARSGATPDRSSLAAVVAVVVVGLVATTAGVAAAHQFVGFDRAPLAGTAGDSVEVPINLHRTDRVTVTVDGPGGGFTAVVVDDGDERATVVVDTGGDSVAVEAESGTASVTDTDGPLGPGEYEVSLSVQRGLGDTTTLTLTAAADRGPSLPTVVAGLVAPLVPVVVLVAVARVRGERRTNDE